MNCSPGVFEIKATRQKVFLLLCKVIQNNFKNIWKQLKLDKDLEYKNVRKYFNICI